MTASAPSREGGILFAGYLGTGNLGNDVSLAVVADAVRTQHPFAPLHVLSLALPRAHPLGLPTTHLDMQRRTRLARLSPRIDRALVKAVDTIALVPRVRQYDAVVIPGAGVLEQHLGDGAWGLPWALAALAVAARVAGTPFHLVAVGADEPRGLLPRLFTRLATSLATSRSFRDERSRDCIRRLGTDTTRDRVIPDLALARQVPAAATPAGAARTGRIGLGVQAGRGGRTPGADASDHYVREIVAVVGHLLDDGHEVTLLVGDDVDTTCFAPIREALAAEGRPLERLTAHASPSFDDLVSTMAACDVVAGSRFHNVIAAVVAGRPVVSIGYADKHRAVMDDLGFGRWCHDITDFVADDVIEDIRLAHRIREEAAGRVRARGAEQASVVSTHLDHLVAGWFHGTPHGRPRCGSAA